MNFKIVLKAMGIIVMCIILSMVLHVLASGFSTMPEDANWSYLVTNLGLPLTLMLWYSVSFSAITIIYFYIRPTIASGRWNGGLSYGIGMSSIWLWAMLEGVSVSHNSFINELMTGLCDALPILLMCVLLGLIKTNSINSRLEGNADTKSNKDVIKSDNEKEEQKSMMSKKKRPKRINYMSKLNVIVLGIFLLIFTCIRYSAYYLGVIKSGYLTYPSFTLLWTIVMGAIIGLLYILVANNANGHARAIKLKPVKFALIIFGINWLVFTAFMPFVFHGLLGQSILRVVIDTLAIFLCCHIVQRFIHKYVVN